MKFRLFVSLDGLGLAMAIAIVPTNQKPEPFEILKFFPDFKLFMTKWWLVVWISNGWASVF